MFNVIGMGLLVDWM